MGNIINMEDALIKKNIDANEHILELAENALNKGKIDQETYDMINSCIRNNDETVLDELIKKFDDRLNKRYGL